MGVDMRITLRARKTNMAQKLLDRAEIRPPSQKVGGKAVAKGVWTGALGQGQSLDTLRNVVADAAICQSTAASVHEQGLGARAGAGTRRQVSP
jgi:hypothetical protein